MTLEQVVERFRVKSYMLEMGAKKLSDYLGASVDDIKAAKKIVRGEMNFNKGKKLPKILIFDIETSPMISYHFGHWKQNIGLDQVIENPILLTWSAKWLFAEDVMSDSVSVEEVLKKDDCRIATSLWKLINEADIIVAHYGSKFDIPMMNSRFIINGLPPTSNVNSIDTKMVASKHFRFPSNKLDALAGYFGFGKKIKTDFLLWRGCMEGNKDKIEEMRLYNVQDVIVLEEVYLKLRPYIKSHPNVGLYMEADTPVCANCGNNKLHDEGNFYYTQAGKYKVYRCTCGALSRVRKTSYDKKKREHLFISTGQ